MRVAPRIDLSSEDRAARWNSRRAGGPYRPAWSSPRVLSPARPLDIRSAKALLHSASRRRREGARGGHSKGGFSVQGGTEALAAKDGTHPGRRIAVERSRDRKGGVDWLVKLTTS